METQILNTTTDEEIRAAVEREKAAEASAASGGLLRVGENINGCVIERRLTSSTGEAEIYLCVKDGTRYVLKYYYNKKPKTEVIEKIKNFDHPDIIKLYDYGEYSGRFFEILQYAEGGALDEKKPDGTYKYLPVPEEEARQIVSEVVNAFDACHKAGIIHRDIKPANLFYKNVQIDAGDIYRGQDILVGDFGISSSFEADIGMSKHLTESGDHTEGYAAPELYTISADVSGAIGPEMDYYSLGVTLWVLLTGEEPFVNEKGHALYAGQIILDTTQGKIAGALLRRSPGISAPMQNLIRGLLTVRHDKRWGHDEVSRFLAGESVEVFDEPQTLPIVEVAGQKCGSYKELAEALITHPEEGKIFVFKGKLLAYFIKFNQKLADRMVDIIEEYTAQKREDEGLVFIAYSLCPNLPFPIEHGLTIESLQDMLTVLETDPGALLPYLRDDKKGFYIYLEAAGLGEHAKKVREIAMSVRGNIRAVSRIIAAFQGNIITPFQDGVNNELTLTGIEQLDTLPDYLQERIPILIQRNYGLLPAWIENRTGKNLDLWLYKLSAQKETIERWGAWKYFTLFLQGKDVQFNTKFGDYGKGFGLKDPFGVEILPAMWEDAALTSRGDVFLVKRNGKWGAIKSDGSVVIPPEYDGIKFFDEERGIYEAYTGRETFYIAENGQVLYAGPDRLAFQYYKGNPFAVIHDRKSKLFSREFAVIKAWERMIPAVWNDKVYIWAVENGQGALCDNNGNKIKELPFTNFRALNSDNKAAAVRDNNKWLVFAGDGERLLFGEYTKIQTNPGYWLLEHDGKSELYKINNDDYTVERVLSFAGNGTIIQDRENRAVAAVTYIAAFDRGYDKDNFSSLSMIDDGRLAVFDGENLLWYDIRTHKTQARNKILNGEGEVLLRFVDGQKLWQIANGLKKLELFAEMNALVEDTWKILYYRGEWEHARRMLFLINKDHMEGLYHVYDFYRFHIFMTLREQDNNENAMKILEEVIALNPSGVDDGYPYLGYYALLQSMFKHDYLKAIEYYDKALVVAPGHSMLFYNKAVCFSNLKKHNEAIAGFTLALESNPDAKLRGDCYRMRAKCYKALGMQDKSWADYAKAKEL